MNFVFQISSKPKILYICADVEVFAHKLILQGAGAGAVVSQCNIHIASSPVMLSWLPSSLQVSKQMPLELHVHILDNIIPIFKPKYWSLVWKGLIL